MKNKREMIRVIKTSENEIILDATGKKNGRGAYLCADSECLKKAEKSKGLERSLKTAIPKEIYEQLEEEMEAIENDKVLQMLGLAARGRKIESGEFSTEKAVKAGKAGLVIVAKDASDNTKKLFRNMCAFYEVPYYEYAVRGFRKMYRKTVSGFPCGYR